MASIEVIREVIDKREELKPVGNVAPFGGICPLGEVKLRGSS